MKDCKKRIANLERSINKLLNPEYKGIRIIIVDEFQGATIENEMRKVETEIGRKLRRDEYLMVVISAYKDDSLNQAPYC